MNVVVLYVTMGVFGIAIGIGGGYFVGGTNGMIIGMFSGLIPFMAVMQIIGFAKTKGFLPLYKNLNEDEEYAWVPNKMNKIRLFIMKKKHKDLLYRKGLGIFENKGTEFNFGNNPMCFAFPESGYTVDFRNIHYFSLLEKDDGVDDYEECIKEYLGEDKYKIFCKNFRENPKPDYYDIDNEIQWLINNKPKTNGITTDEKSFAELCQDYKNKKIDSDTIFTVKNKIENKGNILNKNVFGQTVDFSNRLKYLRYNYDPISSENATEREKIISLKEGMDYRDESKAINRAKAAAMILISVAIFIIILTSVDLSSLFGG